MTVEKVGLYSEATSERDNGDVRRCVWSLL